MHSQYIVLPESLSFSKIFSVKPEPLTTLWYMLHEVPDPRRPQGKRHDLPIVLTLAILALCCGSLSYEAMEEWCRNYQKELEGQVPFLAGHTPDAATFHRVFARIDVRVLEDVLGEWLQTVTPLARGEGIALDGKSIHGAGIHLVAAFAHRAATVLFEQGTDIKGKELVVGPEVLKNITVRDHIVTGDALFAQRSLCELITKRKGGYVFREDHGTIRKGSAPQAMAALRNLVISIFHLGTVRSFPKAQRRFAAKPSELFAFLGLTEVQKQYVYA